MSTALKATLLVVMAVGTAGCSTTATLTTRRGNIEAKIEGGDARNLTLMTETGQALSVPRSEISEIDHPGNVHAVVGGILGGAGLIDLVTFSFATRGGCNVTNTGECIAFGVVAGAGAAMFMWGILTWLWSKSALDPTVPVPITGPDHGVDAPEPAPFSPPPPSASPPPSAPTAPPTTL